MKKRPQLGLLLITLLLVLIWSAPVSADPSYPVLNSTPQNQLVSADSAPSCEFQFQTLTPVQEAGLPAEWDDHVSLNDANTLKPFASLSAPPPVVDSGSVSATPSNHSRTLLALRAAEQALFEGTVTNATDSSGLVGAKIVATLQPTGTLYSAMADVGGDYTIHAPAGSYTLTAIAYGYIPQTLTTSASTLTQQDFPLTPAAFFTVQGSVTDTVTGYPVLARITVTGHTIDPPAPENQITSSGLDGSYSLSLAGQIQYTLTVEATGYETITRTVGPLTGNLTQNLALTPDFAACTAPGYGFVEVFSDGFESGSLGVDWSTYTTNRGRVQVSGSYPYAGSYSVLLDSSKKNEWSMAAAYFTQDLSSYDNLFLDFWWREFKDKNHALDGIFISEDGAFWYQALTFNNGPQTFRNDVVDIAAAAATHGLELNANFGILFNFYGNRSIDKDGYAIDEVLLKSCQPLSGAMLAPERVEDSCCACTSETHELTFVNHTGMAEVISIAFTASPSVTVESIPATLGLVPDGGVYPLEVVVQLDQGVQLGTTYLVTVTAFLAGDPLVSDTSVIEKQLQVIPEWERRQDTSLAIMDHALVATSSYLYQLGGTTDGASGRTDTLRYDAATNSWSLVAPMPTGAYLIDGDDYYENIYILGGYTGTVMVDAVQIYDESADSWSLGAAAPRSRAAYAAVELGGNLYRIGGGDPAVWGSTAEVDLYNPVADTWNSPSDPADYPWPVRWPCAGEIDGKLYVAGGIDNTDTEISGAAVYDPAADAWDDAAMADAPTAFWGAADMVLDGRLVCAGGIQNNNPSATVWVYDPSTDFWGQQADINEARFRLDGDQGYTLGGHNPLWNQFATLEQAGACPTCLAEPDPVTDLSVSRSGSDVSLSWSHVGGDVTYYQVWRSVNAPYFMPGDPGSVHLGDAVPAGGAASYIDAEAIGDVNYNYFYVVLAVNGLTSTVSNRVGEFDIAVQAGGGPNITWTSVAVPLNSGFATADGVAAYIESFCSPTCPGAVTQVMRWDAPTQNWILRPVGGFFPPDFSVSTGDSLMVSANRSYNGGSFAWLGGVPEYCPAPECVQHTGLSVSGWNLVMIPLDKSSILTADGLAADVDPNVLQVTRWDSATQNWVIRPVGGFFPPDFATTNGYPYFVYANSFTSSVWPAIWP